MLRADIDAGDTRTCQAAIDDIGRSFLEMDDTDVPANDRPSPRRAGRLAQGGAEVYHLQRKEFIPSAYAMIALMVTFILTLVMFTNFGGLVESLVRSRSCRSSSSRCCTCSR